MSISVIVATYGDIEWSTLARERARPSASGHGEVITRYDRKGTIASVAKNMNRIAVVAAS